MSTPRSKALRSAHLRTRALPLFSVLPFLALGLLLLIRRRLSDGDRGGLLDAAILTAAVAILSWTFLMQPQVVGAELDPLSLAITLAYPLGDLILIGVAMGLLTTPGARTSSFRLLMGSLVLLLVAARMLFFGK